jgi:hypothetical protein
VLLWPVVGNFGPALVFELSDGLVTLQLQLVLR